MDDDDDEGFVARKKQLSSAECVHFDLSSNLKTAQFQPLVFLVPRSSLNEINEGKQLVVEVTI